MTGGTGGGRAPRAVLLDLDGTLVDTFPDLIAALNHALAEAGLAPAGDTALRALVSHGAGAMLDAALAGRLQRAARDRLLARFLARYESEVAARSRLVPGMDAVLDALEAHAVPWGIVTSKLARFTVPLVRALALDARAACVVSGDSTARGKPHPDPLLHACARLGIAPARCVYVGDARADVDAGRAAGLGTVVAAFGYLAP
ncbi:MAG: HAD-IA family hydrolase, partial [Gammaproteobacteria bacterium]|nr:HAD-IA family hydrolase [Gammaproteobacteria bacterium]